METPRKVQDSVALAFVGCIAPDEPQFHTPAFSRAGQMYQHEVLLGLKRAGLPASAIISVMPIPSRRHAKTGRLWIGGRSADLAEGLSIKFVPFINVTPFKQIGVGIATVFELLRWGWRNRLAGFRVVYCYNLSVPPGLCILMGAWLIRARAIVSLCDIDVPGETVPRSLYWKLDYWMQRRLIPHFDGHVVASDAIAHDFLNGKPRLRLEGGIRKEMLEQTNRRTGAAPMIDKGQPFVIVAAGQLNEINGLSVLLEAFSLLPGDRFRLRIAGSGPLEGKVHTAAAKDARIEFLGLLPFEGVLEIYNSANVLINMRMTKSGNTKYFFPSKMMEYLASGVPVISTGTGHVEKEFGTFTYLLKEETPQGLAQLIQHVADLDPEERRRTGERARTYMFTHKTWETQTEKLAEFIRSTLLHSERRS
jgi:glycosyltransferase involved in cell wall biosynthesis